MNRVCGAPVAPPTRYTKGRPIREWIKNAHDRNEALDCRVYALASLHGLLSMGLQLNREADRLAEIPVKSAEDKPVAKPPVKRPQRIVFHSPWMG